MPKLKVRLRCSMNLYPFHLIIYCCYRDKISEDDCVCSGSLDTKHISRSGETGLSHDYKIATPLADSQACAPPAPDINSDF